MTLRIDRRRLIAAEPALAALAAFGGRAALGPGDPACACSGGARRAAPSAPTRCVTLFNAANPGTLVEGESAGWDSYWTRLATQTAGGNAPDVIQMDYRYIFEYARREALLPLDDLIASGAIDLSGFSPDAIAGGQVDGKTYGVSLGANSSAMIVNAGAFTDAGLAAPERGHQLGRLRRPLRRADGGGGQARLPRHPGRRRRRTDLRGLAAPARQGAVRPRGQARLRRRGRGRLVRDVGGDARERRLRARRHAGARPAQHRDRHGHARPRRRVLRAFEPARRLPDAERGAADAWSPTRPRPTASPASTASRRCSSRPSARPPCPNEAGAFLNFFINDPAATKVLGVERGVPESAPIREMLAAELDEASRAADRVHRQPRRPRRPAAAAAAAGRRRDPVRAQAHQRGDRLRRGDAGRTAAPRWSSEAEAILARA